MPDLELTKISNSLFNNRGCFEIGPLVCGADYELPCSELLASMHQQSVMTANRDSLGVESESIIIKVLLINFRYTRSTKRRNKITATTAIPDTHPFSSSRPHTSITVVQTPTLHFYPSTQDYRPATELSLFRFMSGTQSSMNHDAEICQKEYRSLACTSQLTLHVKFRMT